MLVFERATAVLSLSPKTLSYAALLALVAVWAVSRILGTPFSPSSSKRSSESSSTKPKNPPRTPGVWPPVLDFKRPAASAYPDWDVHTTRPLPYRPFKYGAYHITMGLRSMQWDDWIELDNQFLRFHEIKRARIEERGDKCCMTAPEAYGSACELLEEFCEYLPQRYPSLFRKTGVGMDNLVTGERFDVVRRPLAEDPMRMAARMVQDDVAIMIERPDSQYYLLAGCILLAGFWRLSDKFGLPLAAIHDGGGVPGGGVPGFGTQLKRGMENLFRRLRPDAPFIRNNYSVQVDDGLAWSHSIGPEDAPEDATGWFAAEKNKAIEHHWYRSERQTVRRLPRTGGVVFTIRTYFERVVDVSEEPGVPGRLASAVRGWGEDVARYKGKEKFEEVLLEYLDGKHREQLAKGVVSEDEESKDGRFPF